MTTPKTYKTWAHDSTRWEHYRARDGDIVIATYAKCGTTWMQQIVSLLIFQSPDPRSVLELSPWIDARFHPVDEITSFTPLLCVAGFTVDAL